MCPLFDYHCYNCEHKFEELVSNGGVKPPCPECKSSNTDKLISAHAGYNILGNNSASVRPKGAGSKPVKTNVK